MAKQQKEPDNSQENLDQEQQLEEMKSSDIKPDQNTEQPCCKELENEISILQAKFLRVQAEFDNFRRRTNKEKEDLAQFATTKLITQLLPILDNFERALQSANKGEEHPSFFKGIEMIYRQFYQILESEGVKPMDVVGQPFDPELHEAIMRVESDDHESGIIIENVQTGYLMKNKVIRPAMVKVNA